MSETDISSQKNSQTEEKIEKSTEETTPKAKTPTTPTNNSNWWGSWISQAKEKSASVLEAVKNDLNEITTAVTETLQLVPTDEELQQQQQQQQQQQSESSNASDQQSTVNFANMKQSISSSISTFFGTVTDALIPQLDEEDASEAVLITNDDTIVLTGFTKFLADLQANDETYLEEPSKSEELSEKYRMWLEIVEQDQFTQQRVDKMLEQSTILNEKYNKFVPDTVSHMNFFKRYLFKKALLEDELASEERRRKEALIISKQPEAIVEDKPVTPTSSPLTKSVAPEQELAQKSLPRKNEMNDLDIANFEISEEEQARLLADYEQEIKEREKNKTDDIIIPDDIDDIPAKPKEKTAAKAAGNSKKAVQIKSTASANTSKGKNNNKDSKSQPTQQQQKSNQQQKRSQERSKGKKGDELPIQKDHFKKESESSTSDESWEKDFDI